VRNCNSKIFIGNYSLEHLLPAELDAVQPSLQPSYTVLAGGDSHEIILFKIVRVTVQHMSCDLLPQPVG
jgi:hypothetical protein